MIQDSDFALALGWGLPRAGVRLGQLAHGPAVCRVLQWAMHPPLPFPPEVQLRESTPQDLPALAAFYTAAHPERPVALENLQRLDDSRMASDVSVRVLAERGGQPVGVAEVSTPRMDGHPGWLSIEVTTRPDEQSGPLPPALLALAEAQARAAGATTLITRVREDWWEKAFYEANGYAEHDRMWMSVLDLRTLDFGRFAAQEASALASGVQVHPLSELGPFDQGQQRRLYELIAALLRDVPSTTPISVWPFETWQFRFASKLEHPEGLMVAVAPDGDWVGVCELHLPDHAQPGTLRNGLTGVLAHWRGYGLGLALKLAAARAALQRGYTHSRTGNHSINRPMLSINEALGFVREAATVTLKKEVRGEWSVEKGA